MFANFAKEDGIQISGMRLAADFRATVKDSNRTPLL